MKTAYIIRLESGGNGTFGAILVEGQLICLSLELGWRDNMRNISCIPPGTYLCKRVIEWFNSNRYGYTFEVTGVPDRDGILFHPANWIKEIKGCIAPGTYKAILRGKMGIAASAKAFQKFKRIIGNEEEEFVLVVMEIGTAKNNI